MPHKDPAERAAYLRAWKAANRERVQALAKASYDRNRDGILTRRAQRRATEDTDARQDRHDAQRRYGATYRERHHDEIVERERQRRLDQPEAQRRYGATYRSKHRTEINERRRHAYASDPDAERQRRRMATAAARVIRNLPPFRITLSADEKRERKAASSRRWRQTHPEKARENVRRWAAVNRAYYAAYRSSNAAKISAKNRAWHEAHRDRRREQQRQRYQADPHKYRRWAMDYIARKRRAMMGPVDHDAIVVRDRGICQICLDPVAEPDRSFDHIIPLSLGGPHIQWNLRLTHFRCNARRGAGRIPAQIYLPM